VSVSSKRRWTNWQMKRQARLRTQGALEADRLTQHLEAVADPTPARPPGKLDDGLHDRRKRASARSAGIAVRKTGPAGPTHSTCLEIAILVHNENHLLARTRVEGVQRVVVVVGPPGRSPSPTDRAGHSSISKR